jgi:SAM-dependent methyltransferase
LGYPIEKVDLREGDNLNIPFENDCFDLFVSINAIHYNFGKDFERGIAEYRRVVKEGGVVIIETSAKKHDCVRAANRVNELDYIWNAGDFRDGQHFGFVDNEKQFEDILKKYFSEVEIHHRHEITPKSHLEWYIGVCRA